MNDPSVNRLSTVKKQIDDTKQIMVQNIGTHPLPAFSNST